MHVKVQLSLFSIFLFNLYGSSPSLSSFGFIFSHLGVCISFRTNIFFFSTHWKISVLFSKFPKATENVLEQFPWAARRFLVQYFLSIKFLFVETRNSMWRGREEKLSATTIVNKPLLSFPEVSPPNPALPLWPYDAASQKRTGHSLSLQSPVYFWRVQVWANVCRLLPHEGAE